MNKVPTFYTNAVRGNLAVVIGNNQWTKINHSLSCTGIQFRIYYPIIKIQINGHCQLKNNDVVIFYILGQSLIRCVTADAEY